MSGWVAIPHAALAAAGPSAVRRVAVLSLYEKADRIGYQWMPWTERDLAEEWATDRRTVRALVAALESAGCIELERSEPGARAPSRMLVRRATGLRVPDTDRSPGQNLDQNGRSSQASEDPIGGPDAVPDSGPDSGPPRAELFTHAKTRPDQTRREEQHVGPLADEPTVIDCHTLVFQQAAAYFGERVNAAVGRRVSRGPAKDTKAGRLLFAACKRDAESVISALRFVAESQTERAQKLRAYDGLTIETVLRHVDEYAELWMAHGDRPPPAARAPPLNGRRMGHAGDGVLEAMWRERNPPSEVYDGDG